MEPAQAQGGAPGPAQLKARWSAPAAARVLVASEPKQLMSRTPTRDVHLDMHLPLQTYIAVSDLVCGSFSWEGSLPEVMRAPVLEHRTQAASPLARVQGQVSVL